MPWPLGAMQGRQRPAPALALLALLLAAHATQWSGVHAARAAPRAEAATSLYPYSGGGTSAAQRSLMGVVTAAPPPPPSCLPAISYRNCGSGSTDGDCNRAGADPLGYKQCAGPGLNPTTTRVVCFASTCDSPLIGFADGDGQSGNNFANAESEICTPGNTKNCVSIWDASTNSFVENTFNCTWKGTRVAPCYSAARITVSGEGVDCWQITNSCPRTNSDPSTNAGEWPATAGFSHFNLG
jgi:hypothetical protein